MIFFSFFVIFTRFYEISFLFQVKEEATTNNHKDVMAMDMPEPTNHLDRSRDSRDDSLSEVAEFSDDEDDIPLGKGTVLCFYCFG